MLDERCFWKKRMDVARDQFEQAARAFSEETLRFNLLETGQHTGFMIQEYQNYKSMQPKNQDSPRGVA